MAKIRLLSCLEAGASQIAIIFLHTELTTDEVTTHRKKLEILWNNSVLRCAADSGCNFLHRHFSQGQAKPWVPDLICGDFDSIFKPVLDFYRTFPGVKVEHTPDQDETDFKKSLRLVVREIKERNLKVDTIVAVCSGKGRFDHNMGNVSTLFAAPSITEIPVILMSECDMQYVIPPGATETLVLDTDLEGPYCGLLPVAGTTVVTTSGLRWNMENQETLFGKLVSTSNEIAEPVVTVKANRPILWTMSVK